MTEFGCQRSHLPFQHLEHYHHLMLSWSFVLNVLFKNALAASVFIVLYEVLEIGEVCQIKASWVELVHIDHVIPDQASKGLT